MYILYYDYCNVMTLKNCHISIYDFRIHYEKLAYFLAVVYNNLNT